jgi:hypothetical protein
MPFGLTAPMPVITTRRFIDVPLGSIGWNYMDAAGAARTRWKLRHLLAGLEAGTLGAVYMMIWFMAGSGLVRRSIWDIPNLFATTFYGPVAYQEQYLRSSWSGVALIVLICGLGGVLWGLVWRDDHQPFLTLFGAIAGLAVYFIFFDYIWKHVNPLLPLYGPLRQLQIGYVVWGMALARSPRFSRALAGASQEAVEISSGELIR